MYKFPSPASARCAQSSAAGGCSGARGRSSPRGQRGACGRRGNAGADGAGWPRVSLVPHRPGSSTEAHGLQPLCTFTRFSAWGWVWFPWAAAEPALGWASSPRGVGGEQQAQRSRAPWLALLVRAAPAGCSGRVRSQGEWLLWSRGARGVWPERQLARRQAGAHAGTRAPGLQAPRLPPEQHHCARGGSARAHSRCRTAFEPHTCLGHRKQNVQEAASPAEGPSVSPACPRNPSGSSFSALFYVFLYFLPG